jgi:hypothetical protein
MIINNQIQINQQGQYGIINNIPQVINRPPIQQFPQGFQPIIQQQRYK